MSQSDKPTPEDLELRILEFLIEHAPDRFYHLSFSGLCNIIECNDDSLVTHTLQMLADERHITIGQAFNGIKQPYIPGKDDLKSFLVYPSAHYRLEARGRRRCEELKANMKMRLERHKMEARPAVNIVNNQGGIVGDQYNIGQAGAVGPNAHAHDMTFNQIGSQIETSLDLSQLADDLSKLRKAMSQEANEAEHHIAIGEIAKAEQAARAKDGSKVAEYLRSAGKLAFDFASKIGASLAAEAIKIAIGMK